MKPTLDMWYQVCFIAFWISNADSKGSPWDWQSGNVRYPVFSTYQKQATSSPWDTGKISLRVQPNLTAYEGDQVKLLCAVTNLGEYTISSVSMKDAGWYDCQVNTEPKVSNKTYLTVLPASSRPNQMPRDSPSAGVPNPKAAVAAPAPEVTLIVPMLATTTAAPQATITGPKTLHVPSGEVLSLECTVRLVAHSKFQRIPTIRWTINGKVINTKERAGVSLDAEKLPGLSRGMLSLVGLSRADEGTYACLTEDARGKLKVAAKVDVFVDSADGAEALASQASIAHIQSMAVLKMCLLTVCLFPGWQAVA